MALFEYQALAKNGKKIRGTIDAPTTEAARAALMAQGYYPIDIAAIQAGARLTWMQRVAGIFSRISLKEKVLFTKQLAVLLKSGVPLLQSLELLIEQFQGSLRTMLITIKDDVKEGKSLAEGLARFPAVFDSIYVQLVRAGEASGKLEIILDRLTEYMERRQEITKRVKGALTYPIIQLVVVVLVVIALLTFVLPNIVQTFTQEGKELPFSTRLLMGISDFLLSYYFIIIPLLIILIIAYRSWKATKAGAHAIDAIKLKLPIIKFFTRMGAVVQFSRTLGMLLESGVNLSEALDIVVKVIDNRVLADSLSLARDKIVKQGKISEYLKQTQIFPPMAIYLLNTGEQSGQLDFMLLTVAQNYEADLKEYADQLSSLLEPIMLLVMAVVVGFIVISVIQPILGQAELLNF
jgi:type II secretory pathway component PulF